jgi:hypothetical protein
MDCLDHASVDWYGFKANALPRSASTLEVVRFGLKRKIVGAIAPTTKVRVRWWKSTTHPIVCALPRPCISRQNDEKRGFTTSDLPKLVLKTLKGTET